jgi:drug/metabolite transporter (DMT)-like permease
MTMTRLSADALLLIAAIIWGVAFLFQREAMAYMQPSQFLASRGFLAALVLAPFAVREAMQTGGSGGAGFTATLRTGLVGGVLFFIAGVLQQYGLVTASVTNTGFLTGLYVVITPILLWVVLRRPPSTVVWAAVALAFAGTWALGGGGLSGFSRGDGLVAMCAVFWAMHLLVTDSAAVKQRPVIFTCTQFAIVGIVGLAFAALFEPFDKVDIVKALPAILYTGILSSALTFTILAIAMRHTPPAEASILVSTESVFAAAAAAIVLGERLTPIGLVGACMMFSATVLIQLSPLFERRARS